MKSEYENWENINPYFPSEKRRQLNWELLEEYEDNVFYRSTVPIVRHKKQVKCTLSTYAMEEEPGHYVKSSQYYYTYTLNTYDLMCARLEYFKLNRLLVANHLPSFYGFKTNKENFKNHTALSYNYEKNAFRLFSYTEKSRKLISNFEIIYNEDGTIKKAIIKRLLKDGFAISTFKTYKSGFELYKTTYEGEIKYRRM